MENATETTKATRLYLRLPAETRDKVKAMAKAEKRSLQRQAEFLIEEGLRTQEQRPD